MRPEDATTGQGLDAGAGEGRRPGEVARRLVVRGRVQGVYFRTATRQTALRNGVAGWVRNCDDGSVEAWLEGERGAVEAVEAWIVTGGPPAAEVTDTDASDHEPEGFEGFEVRRGRGTSSPGR